MKFTVQTGELRQALSIIAATLDSRHEAEIGKIYCEAKPASGDGKADSRLWLFSTNGVGRTLMRIPVKVEDPGSWLLSGKHLEAMLAGFEDKDEVRFETKSSKKKNGEEVQKLAIRVGGARGTVPAYAMINVLQTYLDLIPFGETPLVTVPVPVLTALIERTHSFVPVNGNNPNFQNLRLRVKSTGYEATAAGEHVIADVRHQNPVPVQEPVEILIPGRSLSELLKIIQKAKLDEEGQTVKILKPKKNPNQIYFQFRNVIYGTGITSAVFPAVDQVHGKLQIIGKVRLERSGALSMFARCRAFTDEPYISVELKDQKLGVRGSGSSGEVEEALEVSLIEKPAKPIQMFVNNSLFSKALSCAREQEIELGFVKDGTAVIIEAADKVQKSSYVVAGAQE